jgi:hypothetical protein
MLKLNRMLLAAAIVAAPFGMANAGESDALTWTVTPYIFAPSMNVDLKTNPEIDFDTPTISNQSDFKDILDKIDMAFMGHVEAQGDGFGAFVDVMYIDLGDNKDFDKFYTNSDLSAIILDVAGVWSPGDARYNGFEVYAGLRYIDMDFEANLVPNDPLINPIKVDAGDSYSDFLIGARYIGEFNPKWGYVLRADGSFGQTDGTYNLSALLTYRLSHGAFEFGYRYFDVGLPIGNNGGELDMTLNGVVIGYTFVF